MDQCDPNRSFVGFANRFDQQLKADALEVELIIATYAKKGSVIEDRGKTEPSITVAHLADF
jgi:hypothetical protein